MSVDKSTILPAVDPFEEFGRAHDGPGVGVVGNGEELDGFVEGVVVEHLEVAGLLEEGLCADVAELLLREAGHLDEGPDHGILVLATEEAGTVGSELAHAIPIIEGILESSGNERASGDAVDEVVDELHHHVVEHVVALDVAHLVADDEHHLVIAAKVYQSGV